MTVEFQELLTDAVAAEGGQATLNCNVTGVPRPQIAWKKDGELVTNGTKNTVTTYSASSRGSTASQLQIRQVSKEDVAVYSCIAWNRGSIRVSQAAVILTGKFRLICFLCLCFFILSIKQFYLLCILLCLCFFIFCIIQFSFWTKTSSKQVMLQCWMHILWLLCSWVNAAIFRTVSVVLIHRFLRMFFKLYLGYLIN